MKIKTSQGKILNVSVQKGDNIVLMADPQDSPCRIEGRVVEATKHEIDLLKSAPSSGITIDDDFIASDEAADNNLKSQEGKI